MINCSLEDDEVPSYEDTCVFTCNEGYEVTGNETRTCQSDGSWSGNSTLCSKSEWFLIPMYPFLLVSYMKHSMVHCTSYVVL